MPYPKATEDQIRQFEEQGYLIVRGAIDPADLAIVEEVGERILKEKETLAFDWAWQAGEERDKRSFKIVQCSATQVEPRVAEAPFRKWAIEFTSALLRRPTEFWYDQFLAKPPSGESARTPWHQDEGYWGRNLDERGITCWLALHPVDVENGCMHFIPGGHKLGVLEHRHPEGVQSDLLYIEVDEAAAVACPLAVGDVTFHHGKMPHMTPPNTSPAWRRSLAQHFKVVGTKGEGDHYPWKVYVNQFTGETFVPRSAQRAREEKP